MAFNLIENLQKALTNAHLETKMGAFLGENEAAVKEGLDFALPTVIGFIAKKSTHIEGAGSLQNVIRMGNHSSNTFNTLPSLFDGRTNMPNFIEGGKKANSQYFGDDAKVLCEMLNQKAGFKKPESANLLYNLLTPVILSAINKQITIQDLQVSGLRDFMKEQFSNLGGYLPKGVHEILGVAETEAKKIPMTFEKPVEVKKESRKEYKTAVKETVADATETPVIPMRTTLLWLGGILAVIAVAYGIWALASATPQSTPKVDAQIEQTPTPQTAIVAKDTPKPVVNTVPTPSEVLLPNGVKLNVPQGSLEDRIVNYLKNPVDSTLKSKWLDFDRLPFEGETALLKPDALPQIQNIAAIMKAYPRVSFKVGGFVDNATAVANPKLSSQRAIVVFRELVKAGIPRKSLRADGYGATVPIAANDTEEGRAKNRRVALIFTSK